MRAYVQESSAEFSAAQGMYVDTACGWFSDRSVRYLASGKPVLVQDTGFSEILPVGEGLLAFRTIDEAVAGAAEIAGRYAEHCAAARRLAEQHFESDRVLVALLRAGRHRVNPCSGRLPARLRCRCSLQHLGTGLGAPTVERNATHHGLGLGRAPASWNRAARPGPDHPRARDHVRDLGDPPDLDRVLCGRPVVRRVPSHGGGGRWSAGAALGLAVTIRTAGLLVIPVAVLALLLSRPCPLAAGAGGLPR